MPENLDLQPIGIVHSCYTEKFGVPRQANLVKNAMAAIEIVSPYNDPSAFEGLDEFSHIWVVFVFHINQRQGWQPRVRPPRLGGNKRVGVFASRSSFRPNSIGISAVKLNKIEISNDRIMLNISGQDFVNGTPVLDIKPYVKYSDAITDASCSYAESAPERTLEVTFLPSAEAFLRDNDLKSLISDTIAFDPRPSYHDKQNKRKEYGMKIGSFDVKFRVDEQTATVTEIKQS